MISYKKNFKKKQDYQSIQNKDLVKNYIEISNRLKAMQEKAVSKKRFNFFRKNSFMVFTCLFYLELLLSFLQIPQYFQILSDILRFLF